MLVLVHCYGTKGKIAQHIFLHLSLVSILAELQNSFEALLLFDYKYVFVLHVCVLSCHQAPSDNVIMQELKKKNVKILSEKVLLLLNRGGKILFLSYFPCFSSSFQNATIVIHLL